MDVTLNHRRGHAKGVSFLNFFLVSEEQDVIDASPGLLFLGFDGLLKRCVIGDGIRIKPSEPTKEDPVTEMFL